MSDTVQRAILQRAFVLNGKLRAIWRFFLSLVIIWISVNCAFFVSYGLKPGRLFEVVFRSAATVLIVAGCIVLLRIADGVRENTFEALGLSLGTRSLQDAVAGMGLGFALVSVAYIVIRVTCEVTPRVTVNSRTPKLVLADLAMLTVAAMFEEVMFRGYPFQRLVESFRGTFTRRWGGKQSENSRAGNAGALTAALLWSGAFGAVHIGNPDASVWSFLNTAFVGVLFCVAYLRTRSLWMPWGIHFAWNTTLGLVYGLPVSGLTMFSVVVRSQVKGPEWITGGNYGIEASALGTAVIVVGVLAVLLLVKQREQHAAVLDQEPTIANERVRLSIQT